MRRGCELALVLLASCSSEPRVDFTGMYHVDSIVESACATDMPVGGIAYLKLYSAGGGYAVDGCGTSDGTNCARFTKLTEPIEDDGWRNIDAVASINTALATCTLTYSELTAYLVDTSLTMETTIYADTIADSSPSCTNEEARRRGDTMACSKHQLLTATQLMLQP
jgi:hypothetical protein